METVGIRSIAAGDWAAIVALEAETYGAAGLSEGRAALTARADSSPDTCFALTVGPELGGYLLSLPYPLFDHPRLAAPEPTTFRSDNLHLHDLVVAPRFRRTGLAGLLLARLTEVAETLGYQRISLVAVGDSEGFWAGHGFRAQPSVAVGADYGQHAVYMSRVPRHR